MGKIKKKGTSGAAKNYITRTQAVRKLQISLPDFRRLCIFKGIYPREPRSKKKASKTSTPNTTFYYTKDIQYLLHEPLLNKFRDQKSLAKKIARSLGRGEVSDASRLEKNNAPRLTLDHVIKERYPTFIDALRDLDDALSLLFLFATLPSTDHVPSKTVALCQRLCHEFQHYLIMTNSLRRSFLSIKGIYYQATIQGQDIMWLVPYRFVQRVNGDVDYRIMATFVEFYTTLLGFVNFRLDENGAELAAFTLEGRSVGEVPKALEASKAQSNGNSNKEVSKELQAKVDKVIKKAGLEQSTDEEMVDTTDEATDAIDRFEPAAPEADTLPQPAMSGNEAGALFAPFVFYISREAPKAPLEFILRSFGCKRVGWASVLGDGAFTHDESDPRITHQIVDRPQLPQESLPAIPAADENAVQKVQPGSRIPGRTYVQPQWVWDCINEGKLLRADLYAPGATLPPHLSPWVKASRGAYDPRASLADQEEEDEAEIAAEASDSDEEMEDEPAADATPATAEESDEDEESEEEDEDFGGFDEEAASESEDDDEAARTQHQKELEAEAAGLPFTANAAADEAAKKKSSKSKKVAAKKRSEDEELERQKMMMSRKKRKLLEKMMYSNKKTADESAKLRSKRRKLEKGEKAEKK
ncbi:Pescadillo [Penicillium expansum]|nr:Pescadillo [Penicillium expansum]